MGSLNATSARAVYLVRRAHPLHAQPAFVRFRRLACMLMLPVFPHRRPRATPAPGGGGVSQTILMRLSSSSPPRSLRLARRRHPVGAMPPGRATASCGAPQGVAHEVAAVAPRSPFSARLPGSTRTSAPAADDLGPARIWRGFGGWRISKPRVPLHPPHRFNCGEANADLDFNRKARCPSGSPAPYTASLNFFCTLLSLRLYCQWCSD